MVVSAVGRRRREESILFAFDHIRLLADAEQGRAKSLGDYFDELKSPDEQLEDSAAALARMFDATIARDARRGRQDEEGD